MGFKLNGCKLGVATAATQIEGGDKNNSWYDWFLTGHILDNTDTSITAKHCEFVEADTRLMADMGLQVYRLGIEWAKIEPEMGKFDKSALEYYRKEIEGIKAAGIEPMVTLHHFTNPRWFESMGAFEHPDCVKIFTDFVEYAVKGIGDLVSEYCTINEPNVYATEGYMFGDWPPGVKKLGRAVKVMQNLAVCHIRSYELIHKIRSQQGHTDTTVGFANHLRIFEPMGGLVSKIACKYMKNAFQTAVTRACNTGVFKSPLKQPKGILKGKYYDYIGINYYTRSMVKGTKNVTKPNTPINDLGWEIYSEGLAQLIVEQYNQYKAPIYITENGTADKNDAFRAQFIYDHLKVISECGVEVKKYFHWTFYDNFEWVEGNTAKFGLVDVDYSDFSRKIRKSGQFYSEIIKSGGVTDDMMKKYGIK